MELKEGMFIRFKDKQGIEYIRKIKNIYLPEDISYRYGEIKIDKFNHNTNVVSRKNILKASNNIIDLIEVGDYVNGYYIEDIEEVGYEYDNGFKANERVLRTNIIEFDNIYPIGRKGIRQNEIKSIVTKEQFSAMEYKLGDE